MQNAVFHEKSKTYTVHADFEFKVDEVHDDWFSREQTKNNLLNILVRRLSSKETLLTLSHHKYFISIL